MKKIINWVADFFKNLDWAEVFRYFVIGVCSTAINIFSYWLLTEKLGMSELIANPLAWLIATTFAFFTNSFYVFRVKPENGRELLAFAWKFIGERVFTLGVEELIIFVFVTLLHLPNMIVKAFATCVTIALNYIISKFFVFRHKDEEKPDAQKEEGETL